MRLESHIPDNRIVANAMQEYSNNARVSHFLAVAEREYRDRDRGGHQRPRHRGDPLWSPTTRGRAAKPPGPAVAGSYARRVDGDDGGRVASALWESEVSSSTSSSQDEDEPLAPTSSPQDEGELATSTRRRSYIYLPKYCLYCLALFVVVPWVLIAVLFVQRHDVPSQNEAQSNREEVLLKGQNENATMVPSLTPLKIDNGSISVVCPPEWDAARTYTAGEWVGVAGAEVYSCKPHPYTGRYCALHHVMSFVRTGVRNCLSKITAKKISLPLSRVLVTICVQDGAVAARTRVTNRG